MRAAVGKYIKLPPEVLKSLRFGIWNAEVTPEGMQSWLDIMARQGMLQTKIDVAKLITK